MLDAPRVPAERWLTESLDDGFSYSIRTSRVLSKFQSTHQSVEVHESESFGRLLVLDGSFNVSEKDDFFTMKTWCTWPPVRTRVPLLR